MQEEFHPHQKTLVTHMQQYKIPLSGIYHYLQKHKKKPTSIPHFNYLKAGKLILVMFKVFKAISQFSI